MPGERSRGPLRNRGPAGRGPLPPGAPQDSCASAATGDQFAPSRRALAALRLALPEPYIRAASAVTICCQGFASSTLLYTKMLSRLYCSSYGHLAGREVWGNSTFGGFPPYPSL